MDSARIDQTLDVRALARQGGEVQGSAALDQFARLHAEAVALPDLPPLRWQARGEWRTPLGGAGQVWLHLIVSGEVPLVCQRCLEPVREAVAIDRWFRFAADEAQAAALDEESEEDVLALSPDFVLAHLVEDEVLLALPLVPRHDECPSAPKMQIQDAGFDAEEAATGKPNPFAALEALRRPDGSGLR